MTDSGGTPGTVSSQPAPEHHSPGSSTVVLGAHLAQLDGQLVLTLVGDIDMSTADAVRAVARRCLNDYPARLSLDLRSLDFCDMAGVRALRWAQREATAANAEFCIIAPGPLVLRMLTLMNANDLLSAIRDSPQQAEIARPAPSA